MANSKNSLGATWVMVADIGWQMEPFFYEDGLPLVVILSTDDMTMDLVMVGHHSDMIRTTIETILGQ